MCVFGGWRAVKPDMELAFPKHSSRGRTTNMSPLGKSRKFQLDKEGFSGRPHWDVSPKEGMDPGMERWETVLTVGTV